MRDDKGLEHLNQYRVKKKRSIKGIGSRQKLTKLVKTINGLKVLTDEFNTRFYYCDGKLHNSNGPAIVYHDGEKHFYINGKLHREDGPAIICEKENYYEYWVNGVRHRENGPAVVWNYFCQYWVDGVLSCKNGPAVFYDVNDEMNEYWVDGKPMSKSDFLLAYSPQFW